MHKEKLMIPSRSSTMNGGGLSEALILLLAASLPAISSEIYAQDFESPPVLKASEALPSEMQRGESFVVQEQVRNDGFMNHYVVDSDYGQFGAYGNLALAKLIQEIGALDQLEEVSKSEVFRDSLKKSATGQVEAVKEFADKPVETVKGVPGGLKRSFKKYKRDAKEGYGTAKDVTGIGDSDDEDEPESGEEETAGESSLTPRMPRSWPARPAMLPRPTPKSGSASAEPRGNGTRS